MKKTLLTTIMVMLAVALWGQQACAAVVTTVDTWGSTYTVSADGALTDSAGQISAASIDLSTGSLVISAGSFTIPGGNIYAEGSITTAYDSGYSLTVTADGHSHGYMQGLATAGHAWIQAAAAGDSAGISAAVQQANAWLFAESGGAQSEITVVQQGNTINYGCSNTQNFTITTPTSSVVPVTPTPEVVPPPVVPVTPTPEVVTPPVVPVTPTPPVVLPPPPPPTPSVSVSALSVVEIPDPVWVSWSSSDASSCSSWGDWSASGLSGAQAVWSVTSPAERGLHTFGMSCSGPGGSASGSATTNVIQVPRCTISASPSTIIPPQASVLSWSCQYANSCSIDNGIGAVNQTSGSYAVRPQDTTSYVLGCTGVDGSRSFPVTVSVSKSIRIQEVLPGE